MTTGGERKLRGRETGREAGSKAKEG